MAFNDPLYVQVSGVEYSAAEDRKMFGLYTPGVIGSSDLLISAGIGLQASVSSGRAIVPDGDGGGYLISSGSSTLRSLSPSTVNTIYLVVDPDGVPGSNTLLQINSVPTDPYIVLGTATTNGSAVTAVSNTRTLSENVTVAGRYVKKDEASTANNLTVTGNITATGQITGSVVLAGAGVYYSGWSGAGVPADRPWAYKASSALSQFITMNTGGTVRFTPSVNDAYDGASTHATGDLPWDTIKQAWIVPSNGMYLVSAFVVISGVVITDSSAFRIDIRRITSGSSSTVLSDEVVAGTMVTVSGLVSARAGDRFYVEHFTSGYLGDAFVNSGGSFAIARVAV